MSHYLREQLGVAHYTRDSYERRLLNWLGCLDTFFLSQQTPYALFGGSAVAGYIGHLPRKLHDIDLLVLPKNQKPLKGFLAAKGFKLERTRKSKRAGFLKFVHRNDIYELIISVFPGSFRLLNLDDRKLPLIAKYDFSSAIVNAVRRTIRSFDGQEGVAVSVIPMEDLIISKLWPTFEPNTVHDLLLLFLADESLRLDTEYMRQRIESDSKLSALCHQTYQYFEGIYHRTAWYELTQRKDNIERVKSLLKENIFSVSTGQVSTR